jgi:hypothetical protein
MPAYHDWSEYDACVLGETPAQTADLVAGTPAAEMAYNAALREKIEALELRVGILETKERLRNILKDIKRAAVAKSRNLHARIARKIAREAAGRQNTELELEGGQFVTCRPRSIPRAAILNFLDEE